MRHVRRRQARPQSVGSTLVGVLGELLITTGVVMGLFVVWQLWWTTEVANQEAQTIMQEFEKGAVPAPRVAVDLRTDDPPVPAKAAHGQTIGTLIVPTWYKKTNNRMPIVEGTTLDLLDRASAGRYTETQQVGEVGNFALAGHRRTYGNSFLYLPDLVAGDEVIVRTADTWYVYEVTSHEIVTPETVQVLLPVPNQLGAIPTERLLTLTTCHSLQYGAYGNDHRWITYAKFVGWLPASEGMPASVVDDPGVR